MLSIELYTLSSLSYIFLSPINMLRVSHQALSRVTIRVTYTRPGGLGTTTTSILRKVLSPSLFYTRFFVKHGMWLPERQC